MTLSEVLKQYVGETIIINSSEERTLEEVGANFIVLSGGNTQLKLTEHVSLEHVVRIIRSDYVANDSHSLSIDLTYSAGDLARRGSH